MPIIRVVDV